MSNIGIMSDILSLKTQKNRPFWTVFRANKGFEPICKPSSVVYGHLSRLVVADKLKRYSRHLSDGQPYMINAQSCSEWGLHGIPCYHDIGELLPRLSILTAKVEKINTYCGGLFLLHYPEGHPRLTLSGTLSYAARTFLMTLARPATV